MKLFKRIITAFMAVVIIFVSSVTPVAYASWINDTAYRYTQSNLAQWAVHSTVQVAGAAGGTALGTVLIPGLGTVEGAALGAGAATIAAAGIDAFMADLAKDSSFVSESDYVNSLPSVTVVSSMGGHWVDMTEYNRDACTGTVLDSLEYFKVDPDIYFGSWGIGVNIRYYFTVPVSGVYTLSLDYTSFGFDFSSRYVICEASDGSLSSADWSSNYFKVTSSGSRPAITYVGSGSKTYSLAAGSQYYLQLYGKATFDSLDYASPRWCLPSLSIKSSAGATVSGGDYSTRMAFMTDALSNFNIGNGSVNYYIGSVDVGGNINNVYDPALFSEVTKTFTEPVTGQQYLCTDWTYCYTPAIRGYRLDLADGTYIYDGTSIRTIMLMYLDDSLRIIGFKETSEELAEAGVIGENASVDAFYKYSVFSHQYAYVIAERVSSDICDHVYTSETITAPTCMDSGVRRYTCELCGHVRDEDIPATGHSWEVTETVETEMNESGDVTKLGYTIYTCSVCEETYKQYDGSGQPGPPGAFDSESESSLSWLGGLFKKLISSIVNGFAAGIEYLLEHVIGAVADFIVRVTSWAFDLFDGSALVSWFDWFSEDNSVINDEFSNNGAVMEEDAWAYSYD